MRYEDYEAERMKDPVFREAVAKHERYMKYWGWVYYLELWLDYFLERILEKFGKD